MAIYKLFPSQDATIYSRYPNKNTGLNEILSVNIEDSQNRVINDSIKIKDAFIINIGVDFDIVVYPQYNSNEVIFNCISSLKQYFNINNWQINEPIIMKDLYILLDKIEGVQTVKNIAITNKSGEVLGYSPYSYDIVGATQSNVVYPSLDSMIFEVKYPNNDIKGKVVSY